MKNKSLGLQQVDFHIVGGRNPYVSFYKVKKNGWVSYNELVKKYGIPPEDVSKVIKKLRSLITLINAGFLSLSDCTNVLKDLEQMLSKPDEDGK